MNFQVALHKSIKRRPLFPVPTSKIDDALVLQATEDGVIHLVHGNADVWTFSSGGPTHSTYQAFCMAPVNENSDYLEKVDLIPEVMLRQRFGSMKRIYTKGTMHSRNFLVDSRTGKVVSNMVDSSEVLDITRTDYIVESYSLDGLMLWNISVAEFSAITYCSKLAQKNIFPCGRRLPVHQVMNVDSMMDTKLKEFGMKDYLKSYWKRGLLYFMGIMCVIFLIRHYLWAGEVTIKSLVEEEKSRENREEVDRVKESEGKNQKKLTLDVKGPKKIEKHQLDISEEEINENREEVDRVTESEGKNQKKPTRLAEKPDVKGPKKIESYQLNIIFEEEIDGSLLDNTGTGAVYQNGMYKSKPCLIKRFPLSQNEAVKKETDVLLQFYSHPNIVGLVTQKSNDEFHFVVMDRCLCSFYTLVQTLARDNATEEIKVLLENVNLQDDEGYSTETLWDNEGYPTETLLNLLRNVVNGLQSLHRTDIIHGHLDSRNIWIYCKDGKFEARLTNFAKRRSIAMDGDASHGKKERSNLGLLFLYCITKGNRAIWQHIKWRELIKSPEARHLVKALRYRRIEVKDVHLHPFFWDARKRLEFITVVVGIIDGDSSNCIRNELALSYDEKIVDKKPWEWKSSMCDNMSEIIQQAKEKKDISYNYNSVTSLVKLIRNLDEHNSKISEDLKAIIEPYPTGLYNYFSQRFPKLFLHVYKVVADKRGDLPSISKYLDDGLHFYFS